MQTSASAVATHVRVGGRVRDGQPREASPSHAPEVADDVWPVGQRATDVVLVETRRPGSRFRAWVLPSCIVAIPASILFLLPAAVTDTNRSNGDPTTTAQWLFVLGTLAVPLVVTILVAAFGLMDRDCRAGSRPGTEQRLPVAP